MESASTSNQELGSEEEKPTAYEIRDNTDVGKSVPDVDLQEEFKEININDSQHHSEEEHCQEAREVSNEPSPSNIVTSPDGLNVTMNNNKIGSFKEWSKSKLTYTKQLLSESLGYGTKTVDGEIEKQIIFLNESKLLCTALISKAKLVLNHMTAMNLAQKDLGQFMSEQSLKDVSPYKDEMTCTADMYKHMHKHTESYENVLRMFISNLITLNDKTLDDTLASVRQYEACRVEYDAYRVEYNEAQKTNNMALIKDAQTKYEQHLSKFNQYRSDILVKVKLFKENKEKVIKRNLNVLQSSLLTYTTDLSASHTETASHYNFKPISEKSWLESND